MIAPGALVTCRQAGKQLFVAVRQNGDGSWHLRGKLVDHKGREVFNGRSNVGAGDITVVKAAPQFEVGEIIELDGLDHEVLRDLGDAVELLVPSHSLPLLGGTVRVPGGNRITVGKSDVMLEAMK